MSIPLSLCRAVAATFAVVAFSAQAQTSAAPAQSSTSVWLSPGIYSRHFDRNKNLRDGNPGVGVEVGLARDHSLLAGTFINSNNARTHYAGYAWRPLHWIWDGVDVSGGVIVAAFDGYPNYKNGGSFVAPLPVLAFEGKRFGVNVSIIPTLANRTDGALSFQFKFKVW